MPRNLVDEDKNRHCSSGLHVGAMGYVKRYGSIRRKPEAGEGNRVVIVKVNPKDAVSVPQDENCQKLRVSSYEVIAELSDYDMVLERAVYSHNAQTKKSDIDNSKVVKPIIKKSVNEPDSVFSMVIVMVNWMLNQVFHLKNLLENPRNTFEVIVMATNVVVLTSNII